MVPSKYIQLFEDIYNVCEEFLKVDSSNKSKWMWETEGFQKFHTLGIGV